ncbi:MAG: hypothetical protein JRE23_03375 [Deltaproteobacteria bacterium]|nr:hypothetical protein [Deltaproteobacteria bacterium]
MALTIICKVCKKKFPPTHFKPSVTPVVCSCKCAVIFYAAHKPKSRKLAREVAGMVGRRSMAEVKFDAANIEGKKIDARYENDTFEYSLAETRKYTPDWTVYRKDGKVVYLEYKGVLDGTTRKKMKLMKKQWPILDIRLIFEKAGNKIYKGSKTTYGMWATQHGFKWEDNVMPKDCKK